MVRPRPSGNAGQQCHRAHDSTARPAQLWERPPKEPNLAAGPSPARNDSGRQEDISLPPSGSTTHAKDASARDARAIVASKRMIQSGSL